MEQEDKRITAVVTRNVFPGRERDYEEWGRRVVAASARYGATGHTFLTPNTSAPRRVLIAQFPDEAGARAWDESEERDRLVREAAEFSTMDIQRITGLEAWFTLPGEQAIVPPSRWKQLLVTLIGAYPLVVLVSAFIMPQLQGWPLLLRSAVLPVVLLTLMTYVVMPLLTQLFRGWLYPRRSFGPDSTGRSS
jgi:antibiotic biosynthesis monooxygenase (ABM) superfamily enzyme